MTARIEYAFVGTVARRAQDISNYVIYGLLKFIVEENENVMRMVMGRLFKYRLTQMGLLHFASLVTKTVI